MSSAPFEAYHRRMRKSNVIGRQAFRIVLVLSTILFACKNEEKAIRGVIRISPEIQAKIQPGAVLYVIARPEGAAGGPPLAVKRVPPPLSFPVDFEISARDAMIPDSPFTGRISVSARISQSGAAIPANPGDLESAGRPTAVEPGAARLEIVLDKVRE